MPIATASQSMSDAELQSITIPTLLLVGTLDDLQAETARASNRSPAGTTCSESTWYGANHTHFANVCQIGNALINAGVAQEHLAVHRCQAIDRTVQLDLCTPGISDRRSDANPESCMRLPFPHLSARRAAILAILDGTSTRPRTSQTSIFSSAVQFGRQNSAAFILGRR